MLIYNMRDLFDNPPALFALLGAMMVAFVTGIAFHEFCHAWAANELGDDTAKRQGRLTLNPIKHIDPTGFLVLILIGFGWGRPTPVNPYRLKNGPLRGNMLVALAGPVSNFVFAIIAATPLRLGWVETASINNIADASGGEILGLFLYFIAVINIILGIFNLIPIPPLDGFKVLVGLAPREIAQPLLRIEPYGPGILMAFIAIGFIAPELSPIRWIFDLVADDLFDLIL